MSRGYNGPRLLTRGSSSIDHCGQVWSPHWHNHVTVWTLYQPEPIDSIKGPLCQWGGTAMRARCSPLSTIDARISMHVHPVDKFALRTLPHVSQSDTQRPGRARVTCLLGRRPRRSFIDDHTMERRRQQPLPSPSRSGTTRVEFRLAHGASCLSYCTNTCAERDG